MAAYGPPSLVNRDRPRSGRHAEPPRAQVATRSPRALRSPRGAPARSGRGTEQRGQAVALEQRPDLLHVERLVGIAFERLLRARLR
jgi:hypothetical protein